MAKPKVQVKEWIKKQKWLLLAIIVLWIIILIVSWWLIPGWQGTPGNFWVLVGISAPVVVAIISSLLGIFRKVERKTIIAGDSIGRDQWIIYLSAPTRGELSEPEFYKILDQYLQWVANFFSQARLWGLDNLPVIGERPVRNLMDVFIPLSLFRFTATEMGEIEEFAEDTSDGLDHFKVYLRENNRRQEECECISLSEILTLNNKLVVVGDPGIGKSTLLAYLAVNLASSQSDKNQIPKMPVNRKSLIPIVIPLRNYPIYKRKCNNAPETSIQNSHAGTLVGFILYTLEQMSGMNFSGDFFERLLIGGGCLVMLDGLDGIVNQQDRAIVRQQIEDLSRPHSNNYFLVTTREAAYKQDAVFGDDFTRLQIKHLDDNEVKDLVTNWCKQLYPIDVEAKVQEILKSVDEINSKRINEDLPRLLSTPLMITMVISDKWRRTRLPRNQARFFEAAVKVIIQEQYTPADEARNEVVNLYGPCDTQYEWLAVLAYTMHSSNGGRAAITEGQVKTFLKDTVIFAELDKLIYAIRSRGGMLEERANQFQFLHFSFQEFMAAHWIASQRNINNLTPYLANFWWRGVFLLTYGYALQYYPRFASEILTWLTTQVKNDDNGLSGLELAGAALLENDSPQAEMKPRIAGRIVGFMENCDCEASIEIRARAADTLSELGDPRFDDKFYFLPNENLCGFVLIKGGPFLMGSNQEEDPLTSKDEFPKQNVVLQDFYMMRYPVTVAQYRYFIDQTHHTTDESSLKGFSNRPVGFVTWYDAIAYSDWLSIQLQNDDNTPNELRTLLVSGWRISLPSEAEWEKAARGPDGRIYPWGDDFDQNKANTDETKLGHVCPVGCFPYGTSQYGIHDMAGNIWEWTRSKKNIFGNDYDFSREIIDLSNDDRIYRGGAFNSFPGQVRCAYSESCSPKYRGGNYGFRLTISQFSAYP